MSAIDPSTLGSPDPEARAHAPLLPPSVRRTLDAALSWAALGYGFFAAAIGSVQSDDEMQIAIGGEAMLLALLDFLWAGARRSLGAALIAVGLAAPIIAWSTSPLFWYDTGLFSEAFWTCAVVGGAAAVPLVVLGRWTWRRAEAAPRAADPRWFKIARHVIRGGLWLVVLAFQRGDWSSGVWLVYLGAALALTSLILALPRRLAVSARGQGLLLVGLGGGALVVTLLAGAMVGSHMSGEEALVGIIPALVVAAAGGLLLWWRRG